MNKTEQKLDKKYSLGLHVTSFCFLVLANLSNQKKNQIFIILVLVPVRCNKLAEYIAAICANADSVLDRIGGQSTTTCVSIPDSI